MKNNTKSMLATVVAGTATAILDKLSNVAPKDIPPRSPMREHRKSKEQDEPDEEIEPMVDAPLLVVETDEMDESKIVGVIRVKMPLSIGADGEKFIKALVGAGEEAWAEYYDRQNESEAT